MPTQPGFFSTSEWLIYSITIQLLFFLQKTWLSSSIYGGFMWERSASGVVWISLCKPSWWGEMYSCAQQIFYSCLYWLKAKWRNLVAVFPHFKPCVQRQIQEQIYFSYLCLVTNHCALCLKPHLKTFVREKQSISRLLHYIFVIYELSFFLPSLLI